MHPHSRLLPTYVYQHPDPIRMQHLSVALEHLGVTNISLNQEGIDGRGGVVQSVLTFADGRVISDVDEGDDYGILDKYVTFAQVSLGTVLAWVKRKLQEGTKS